MAEIRDRFQVNLPFPKMETYGRWFIDRGLAPEIGLSGPVLDHTADAAFRTWARAFQGRRLTVHAPFMELSPGGTDPEVVRITRRRLCRAAEAAGILGASAMVCHAGYEYRRYPHGAERWVTESVRTWNVVLEAGAKSGLTILLENVYERDPEMIRRVLAEADNPRLKACFDTGHFNVWSRRPLPEWLEALEPRLARLHLHDNDGSFDQHLPIGEGSFDFRGLLLRLKERGLSPGITLEPHTRRRFFRTFRAFRILMEEFDPARLGP